MAGQLTRYLAQPNGAESLPVQVRVTPDGQLSVIDIVIIACFTGDDGIPTKSARKNASEYFKRLCLNNEEASTLCGSFRFPGRGQQDTPVTGRKGIFRILQLLRGQKAAKFRERLADLLERYLDADPALADDIVDRALDNHAAAREAAAAAAAPQPAPPAEGEQHVRLRSRDATKYLGAALKENGGGGSYALFNGGVNTAVTGMRTAVYRGVQVNLGKGPARDAFTDGMQAMAYTFSTLAGEGIERGETLGAQIDKLQGTYADAAEMIGLHDTARIVQPKEHIEKNQRRMIEARPSYKRLKATAPPPHALPPPEAKTAGTMLQFLKPVPKQ